MNDRLTDLHIVVVWPSTLCGQTLQIPIGIEGLANFPRLAEVRTEVVCGACLSALRVVRGP